MKTRMARARAASSAPPCSLMAPLYGSASSPRKRKQRDFLAGEGAAPLRDSQRRGNGPEHQPAQKRMLTIEPFTVRFVTAADPFGPAEKPDNDSGGNPPDNRTGRAYMG